MTLSAILDTKKVAYAVAKKKKESTNLIKTAQCKYKTAKLIGNNRKQACIIVKNYEKSEMEHQIVCNTVKLDKRFYNIKNFLVTYGPYFSQYSKHCVGKDFE